jgi:hypothetical protein
VGVMGERGVDVSVYRKVDGLAGRALLH